MTRKDKIFSLISDQELTACDIAKGIGVETSEVSSIISKWVKLGFISSREVEILNKKKFVYKKIKRVETCFDKIRPFPFLLSDESI